MLEKADMDGWMRPDGQLGEEVYNPVILRATTNMQLTFSHAPRTAVLPYARTRYAAGFPPVD